MEIKVRKLTSWIEKTLGLMGTRNPEAVFFRTRFGIHTLFMRFPIDVVILDDKNTVKTVKKGMLPYRFFLWNPKYENVLELPPGTIQQQKIRIEEKLTLTFV